VRFSCAASETETSGRQVEFKLLYYGSSSSSYWKIDRSKRVDVKFFTTRAQRRKELWKKTVTRFSKEIFFS
jgi:hypothetical protein